MQKQMKIISEKDMHSVARHAFFFHNVHKISYLQSFHSTKKYIILKMHHKKGVLRVSIHSFLSVKEGEVLVLMYSRKALL